MSVQHPSRLSLGQYADRFRNEMIPLGSRFCYYSAAAPLSEDDRKDYLDEPVAALPPVIATRLPEVRILLVPYLEKGAQPKNAESLIVSEVKPHDTLALSAGAVMGKTGAVLAFAVKDAEVADYHYRFYSAIANLIAGPKGQDVPAEYIKLLRAELEHGVHGEVDESGWRLKVELTEAEAKQPGRTTKRFKDYARQSFVDTLTLYMHGICCDIDVETGPRQLPSNYLRKRLKLIKSLFPPPQGYAVFPEDLPLRPDPRT
jgi:hypothetical protein